MDPGSSDSSRLQRAWPTVLAAGVFLFYLFTLAPTILWGDDAYFQRAAFTGELRPDGSGHWLWLQAGQLFRRLPWGDVAFRVNLLSAVAGAGTILILYLAAREVGLRTTGASAAALSLAVGHTFWMHAVRAEVYTVFTVFLALTVWLWARWRRGRNRPLFVAAGLFGTSLLAHQMALLTLPAWAFLLWRRRAWLIRRECLWLGAIGALGLLPFFVVVRAQIGAVADVSLWPALRLYFTHSGIDFAPAFFDFAPGTLFRDAAMWLGLLGLQFAGLSFLLGAWGMVARVRAGGGAIWWGLLLLYATDVFFAISYRVNDRFVFFLPGYVAFALFVGAGWEAAQRFWRDRVKRARLWSVVGMALLVGVPIALYYTVPQAMTAAELNPLNIRSLPGREPNRFFLWPSKRDHWGAARYAHGALDSVEPDAVLLADHTPLEALRYAQIVEGMRPDVTLVKIEPGQDLAPVVSRQELGTPIYVASDDPQYYNLRNVPGAALAPAGPVYRLRRDAGTE